MPAKRCPKCRALSADDAEFCSMCGQTLMGDVEEKSEHSYVVSTDAGRWVGPNVPAPGAAHLARDRSRRRPPRSKPRLRTRRRLPTIVYLLAGLAIGALVSATLIFFTGLIDRFAFDWQARSQPAVGIGGLDRLASSVATGAILGAMVGALVAFADSVWAGMALFVAAFMLLEGWALPGGGLGVTYGLLALAGAGAWGAAYGYLVSVAVHAALQELLTQPSE